MQNLIFFYALCWTWCVILAVSLGASHYFLIAMLASSVSSLTSVISRHSLYSGSQFLLFSDKESIYYSKYYVKCLVMNTIIVERFPPLSSHGGCILLLNRKGNYIMGGELWCKASWKEKKKKKKTSVGWICFSLCLFSEFRLCWDILDNKQYLSMFMSVNHLGVTFISFKRIFLNLMPIPLGRISPFTMMSWISKSQGEPC